MFASYCCSPLPNRSAYSLHITLICIFLWETSFLLYPPTLKLKNSEVFIDMPRSMREGIKIWWTTLPQLQLLLLFRKDSRGTASDMGLRWRDPTWLTIQFKPQIQQPKKYWSSVHAWLKSKRRESERRRDCGVTRPHGGWGCFLTLPLPLPLMYTSAGKFFKRRKSQ